MTLRTRVRLTAKDWDVIYAALGSHLRTGTVARVQTVIRKIGANGMAARARGVAPVRKGKR